MRIGLDRLVLAAQLDAAGLELTAGKNFIVQLTDLAGEELVGLCRDGTGKAARGKAVRVGARSPLQLPDGSSDYSKTIDGTAATLRSASSLSLTFLAMAR